MSELPIWTVYDHPRDFPSNYVARLFLGEHPTGEMMISPDLAALRDELMRRGLVRLERFPEDDPVVMETWL